jgi:hypothetical protein
MIIGSRLIPQNNTSVVLEQSKEEKSSLLNDQESQDMSNLNKEPLQFEDLADHYDKLQRNLVQPVEQIDEKEMLKQSINKFIGEGLEDHLAEALNKSIIEDDSEFLQKDLPTSSLNQVSVDVKDEEEKQAPLQRSELSQEEKDKLAYLTEMESAQI